MSKVKCAMGLFAAYAKRLGSIIDDEALGKKLDTHGKAVFGNANSRYVEDTIHVKETPGIKYAKEAGLQGKDMVGYLADGDAIIGKDAVKELNAVYQDYLKTQGKGSGNWDRLYKPKVEALRDKYIAHTDTAFKDLAEKYWNAQIRGGQIEGQLGESNPFSKAARNAVGNLVHWNPLITTMNVFEFMPKALAYGFEHGDPGAVMRGMARAFKETGNVFKQDANLKKLGVYGFHDERWNLLHLTENPLRTLSYFIGEELQKGQGLDALEKIAFVSKLGNEPLIFLDHTGTDTMALMRYSVSSTKMYLRLLNGARQGNVKSIAALAAWSGMQAIQTGGASAIPLPIYSVMPDDMKQSISQFDDTTGLNLSKHIFNTDYTKYTQPLSLPILGAGLSIASSDVKGSFTSAGKGVEAAGEGNLPEAGARFLSAAFGAGQLFHIPGVNLTSKRVVDTIAKVAAGDVEATPEAAATEFGKETKLVNESPY